MKKSNSRTPAKKDPVLPERLVGIDLLKGFAIIAVILIHTWSVGILLSIGAPFHVFHAVALLLLVAGFTGTYAYMRRGSITLGQCYETGILRRRYARLIKPYLLMFIIQLVFIFMVFHNPFDAGSVIVSFATGGYGLGAYFVPVIIQSVIVVPVLYLIALRNPDAMLAVAFILNLLVDIPAVSSGVPPEIFSVLYIRYLFVGALGVWLALSTRRLTVQAGILGFLSAAYIGITYYTQVFSRFFEINPGAGIAQAPAYIWTYILALFGLMYLPGKSETLVYQGLENAGKASWHIFLVQMTFFSLWQPLNTGVLIPLYHLFPPAVNFVALIVIAACTVVICAGTGCLWYRWESKRQVRNGD